MSGFFVFLFCLGFGWLVFWSSVLREWIWGSSLCKRSLGNNVYMARYWRMEVPEVVGWAASIAREVLRGQGEPQEWLWISFGMVLVIGLFGHLTFSFISRSSHICTIWPFIFASLCSTCVRVLLATVMIITHFLIQWRKLRHWNSGGLGSASRWLCIAWLQFRQHSKRICCLDKQQTPAGAQQIFYHLCLGPFSGVVPPALHSVSKKDESFYKDILPYF